MDIKVAPLVKVWGTPAEVSDPEMKLMRNSAKAITAMAEKCLKERFGSENTDGLIQAAQETEMTDVMKKSTSKTIDQRRPIAKVVEPTAIKPPSNNVRRMPPPPDGLTLSERLKWVKD